MGENIDLGVTIGCIPHTDAIYFQDEKQKEIDTSLFSLDLDTCPVRWMNDPILPLEGKITCRLANIIDYTYIVAMDIVFSMQYTRVEIRCDSYTLHLSPEHVTMRSERTCV